jgi:hypothetical protein
MKIQLQQAIAQIQAGITAFGGISQLSGNIDNSIFNPLFALLQQTEDPNGAVNAFIAAATPAVDAIPDGI